MSGRTLYGLVNDVDDALAALAKATAQRMDNRHPDKVALLTSIDACRTELQTAARITGNYIH